MKLFIYIAVVFACLASTSAKSQTYYGFDSTSFNGQRAIVFMPAGTGPFAVSIQFGPAAETLDQSTCGMCTLFNTGTPKLIKAGANPCNFVKGNGDSAHVIVVKIQLPDYNAGKFSNDMALYLPAIMTYLGSKVDSTKYADGSYKYISQMGEEHGADVVFNSVTQNTASNHCFFNGDPGWVFRHIKKLYVARTNDICQYGSYTNSAAYANSATEKVWYYRVTGASTNEPALQTGLATYSPGVVQKLTNFTLSTSQLSDTFYSVQSPYYTNNVFRDLVDDTFNHPPPNYIAKVYTIFSLSTYAQHDQQPPQNFFDGYLVADPKNGVLTDTTSPGNPQHKWDTTAGAPQKPNYNFSGDVHGTIWPGNRQIRLIFDLSGAPNLRDRSRKFSITDIYGLSGEEAGHSMYWYSIDSLFDMTPINAAWHLARPDSLMKPFDTLTTTGFGAGWTNIPAHDSGRYFMVMITTSSSHASNFDELVIYGHRVGDTTGWAAGTAPPTYMGPLPSKKSAAYTVGKMNGTNLFEGLGALSTSHDGDFRLYTSKWYYDTANVRNVPTGYKFWESADVNVPWALALNAAGKSVHYTNQSSNQYAAAQGSQADVDSSGLDPEIPTSYMRAGDFAFWYSRIFGHDTRAATPDKWVGRGSYTGNGLGLFDTYEAGNENEAHGSSYMGMFMKLSMEWDGHCGAYGVAGKTGTKNGDSTMLLSVPGMVDPDTNFVATARLLTALTRTDSILPFKIVQVHKYLNIDTLKGNYLSLEQQIGMRGESPENFGRYGYRGWLTLTTAVARNMYKWMPTSNRIDLGESGGGNCNQVIINTGEAASVYDIYPWLSYDTLSVHQAKAIILARMRLLMMASPFAKYNNYASSNQFGDTNNSVRFLFYAYGIAAAIGGYPFDFSVFYAGWYYQAGFYHQMKNYYFDSVMVNGGATGKWVLKFRNAYQTDSVCYATWKGSYTNATLTGQTVNLGNLTSQSVTKWVPSFTDTTGTTSSLTASGGVLSSQTITESPVLFFVKEAAIVPDPTKWGPVRWRAFKKVN